jgi:hypothetical protein
MQTLDSTVLYRWKDSTVSYTCRDGTVLYICSDNTVLYVRTCVETVQADIHTDSTSINFEPSLLSFSSSKMQKKQKNSQSNWNFLWNSKKNIEKGKIPLESLYPTNWYFRCFSCRQIRSTCIFVSRGQWIFHKYDRNICITCMHIALFLYWTYKQRNKTQKEYKRC